MQVPEILSKKYSWYREVTKPDLPPGCAEWPRITVVTPSYNQGSFIEETIVSVLSQGYPNLEYFIVDGGSTDHTVSVIEKFGLQIDWWVSEKDQGQTDAINKGFRRATGEIINWINSDDILYPGALYEIALAFMNNPDAGFVYGRTEKFNAEGSIGFMQHPDDDLPLRYFYGFPYGQQGCFYRRRLVEEAGYLNEKLHFSMDYDLFVRLNMRTDAVRINAIIGGFRDHVASKSNNLESIMVGENLNIFRCLLTAIGYNEGILVLEKCGAKSIDLRGYSYDSRRFSQEELYSMTAKFLLRYMFFSFENRNYKYVYHAYNYINKYMPELIHSQSVYRAMYVKARLLRFFQTN